MTNSLRGSQPCGQLADLDFDLQTKNGCFTSTSLFDMYPFVYYITYIVAYRYHSSCVYKKDQQFDDKMGWLFSLNVHDVYLFLKYDDSPCFDTNLYLLYKFALSLLIFISK